MTRRWLWRNVETCKRPRYNYEFDVVDPPGRACQNTLRILEAKSLRSTVDKSSVWRSAISESNNSNGDRRLSGRGIFVVFWFAFALFGQRLWRPSTHEFKLRLKNFVSFSERHKLQVFDGGDCLFFRMVRD